MCFSLVNAIDGGGSSSGDAGFVFLSYNTDEYLLSQYWQMHCRFTLEIYSIVVSFRHTTARRRMMANTCILVSYKCSSLVLNWSQLVTDSLLRTNATERNNFELNNFKNPLLGRPSDQTPPATIIHSTDMCLRCVTTSYNSGFCM